MKKVAVLLLAISMMFSLCACGSNAETTASSQEPDAGVSVPLVWEKAYYLDDFHQPTDKVYIGNIERLVGTFDSNSVTDGDLAAEVRVDGSKISILLYENGSDLVKNGEHVDVIFPIVVKKSDGSTFSVNGIMESGADCITILESQVDCVMLGPNTEEARSTSIATALCAESGEVSFYITRDDQPATSYLFSVECGNFSELYNDGIAKTIQELAYMYAEDYLRNGQLEEALNMFSALGTYSDSTDRVQAVRDEINARLEADYQAAEVLVKDGKLGLAAIRFWSIRDYKDAHERSLDLWARVTGRKTIATGGWHSVAVKEDGTVVATGLGRDGQKQTSGWSDIIAVDACLWNTVGLKADGTVVAVGQNDYGQRSVSKWDNIVAIASGEFGTLGLKADGTVVVTSSSQTRMDDEISKWPGDIVSISGGRVFVGLKADGTVISTDAGYQHLDEKVADWSDIVAIASGGGVSDGFIVGLKSDGTVIAVGKNDEGQCNVSDWTDIVAISAGLAHTVGLKSDGTVVAVGYNGTGACNVSKWTDIVAISAGGQHTIGLKADGTMVAVGSNADGDGQCNVASWEGVKVS